jgi:uncharacterized repeat protein (TIGR01451 family)
MITRRTAYRSDSIRRALDRAAWGAIMGVAASLVIALAGGARAGELVVNGGFETGSFSGWTHGAGQLPNRLNPTYADHAVVLDLPFGGNYSALLGFKYTAQRRSRYGYMYQDVAIPSNISRATLFFKFRVQGYDGLNYDPFIVEIRNPTNNNTLATVVNFSFSEWNYQFKDSWWMDDDNVSPVGYSMTGYAGSTVRLYFNLQNLIDDLYETWAFVDDVSLVYKKFVDLAVDGNGDDLFGNTGTGAGGSSIRPCEAGGTATYLLDVENEGLDSDSYTLSVTPPAGWNVTLEYGGTSYSFPWNTPTIPAGSKIQVRVLVRVPSGQPLGGYSTILNAISPAHANRYDSVRLTTNVVPVAHLTDLAIDANGFGVIDPTGGGGISYRETDPNTQVTYVVDLLNAGSRVDSFRVWFTSPAPLSAVIIENGRTHTSAFNMGPIGAGSTASMTLRVTVPPSLVGGDYANFVFARSRTDTLKKDGVRAVTRVRAPKLDMIICGSGDDIIDGTGSGLGGSALLAGMRGATVAYPLIVQNEGGVVDSFTISWTSPGAGWTARVNDGSVDHALPWTTPSFAPFSQKSYALLITIPSGAAYDTYQSILGAVSRRSATVMESVSANITVSSGNEVDLVIDGNGDNVYAGLGTGLGGNSIKTARPGDVVTFQLTVQNESGENLFDLSWTKPAGWDVRIGDSTSTMRRVAAGVYTLRVTIPAGSMGGTFDVIVDGVKTNKRFFVDSVRGRIIVLPPHRVDALIDGNGDDVFGQPGTGAGGSSLQSTIGGRTIHFTLELQNQGGEAEQYRVTWNAIAGWTARLAGSTSPYTTPSILPGASGLYTFEVVIPTSAAEGDHDYTLDVVSTTDPNNVESVRARIHINPPPRVDLVIDGNGANVTAPVGTGEGGRAIRFGNPGTMVTAVLEVVNSGGFPDSFRVTWKPPADWPPGSVFLADSTGDHGSPYVTTLIYPGLSRTFTVKVFIPAGAGLRSRFIMDAVGLSRNLEDSITLEIAITSFVTGIVFDDADHDGLFDAGEQGWSGVAIRLSDLGGPMVRQTDGSGRYLLEVAPGLARQIVETTPAGMISLSPDTVSLAAAAVGETLRVDFADVELPTILPANDLTGPSGAFIDCAHTITAGTGGAATLIAALPAGWIAVYYRDRDGDGVLGAADSLLAPFDLALDPLVPGGRIVPVIVRVFVPPQVPAGTAASLTLTLRQVLAGTAIAVEATVTDRLLIIARASGLLQLTKAVDLTEARPGDVITYTITFMNPGVRAVQEIEIIDPISPSVEMVLGAFGPGRDIEWVKNGSTEYLTADPGDADEAMLESPEGRLSVILSRRSPFVLESGASGRLVYRVRIR